ncbi:Protein muscleblind [Blattella germanica]|nr:Protein muscleblind [Blattella germanica]
MITPPPAPPNPPSSPLPQTAAAAGTSMAMVNMNNLLNGKDSRWLQLEVCREFQRNKCTRPDTECKFAHPPANVEVQNGRVTACYDSIKCLCKASEC